MSKIPNMSKFDFDHFDVNGLKKIIKFHEVRDNIELSVLIRINMNCNYKCPYCHVGSMLNKKETKDKFFPIALYRKWIYNITNSFKNLKLDKKIIPKLTLLGGEVFLLNDDIIESYLNVTDIYKDIDITILTNGSYIEKMIKMFKKYNYSVIISWHPTQISYEKFKENMKYFKEELYKISPDKLNHVKIYILSTDKKNVENYINELNDIGLLTVYKEIDHVAYYDFYKHYTVTRKCYAFNFHLDFKNPIYIKNHCFDKDSKLYKSNITHQLDLRHYIIGCNKRCSCPTDEIWLYKEKYSIKKLEEK